MNKLSDECLHRLTLAGHHYDTMDRILGVHPVLIPVGDEISARRIVRRKITKLFSAFEHGLIKRVVPDTSTNAEYFESSPAEPDIELVFYVGEVLGLVLDVRTTGFLDLLEDVDGVFRGCD